MRGTIISLKFLMVFILLTGIVYPLTMTGISEVLFPRKANGSIILRNGVKVGSELIGQRFDTTIYFSSRPSAVSYNPIPSGGSNQSLTNFQLVKAFIDRRHHFLVMNMADSSSTIVPPDMLFASGSGLDPHISPESAYLQVNRIAAARNFTPEQKKKLITLVGESIETPQYLILGERRVNVLLLNLKMLDIE
jgi:K+-transporting ATPase ATPase C chain